MSRFEPQRDWKTAAYGTARHGVVGMVLRPVFGRFLDAVAARITHKAAALVVGGLFLAFAVAASMDRSHREAIVAEQRYSQESTEAYPWRYDIGSWRQVSRGRRVWRGERHGFHVNADDWAQHRLWSAIRTGAGWSFLVAALVAGIALWRKRLHEDATAVFGEGSEEYDAVVHRPSSAERDRRNLEEDWLLSGVPERPTADGQVSAQRPRFGRKQV